VSPRDEAWLRIDVDHDALVRNMTAFRDLVPRSTRLLAVVKADGYGHGASLAARAFLAGGADILGVHSLAEARALRADGVESPVLVLGPATAAECAAAAQLDLELTVGSLNACEQVAASGAPARIHLKVETGVNRQGLVEHELKRALAVLESAPTVRLVGVSSHFADIEDTTDHAFAESQMSRFRQWRRLLGAAGHTDLAAHMSCSAAVLVWGRSHADIHRPRRRIRLRHLALTGDPGRRADPRPPGDRPGAGPDLACTRQPGARGARGGECGLRSHLEGHDRQPHRRAAGGLCRRLAPRPVGVLIGGKRAPLVGRICMNLCMADVTHVPGTAAGDDAVLLGRQGGEAITAEMLADQLGTIPYEVLTLPGAAWSRRIV